MHPPDFKHNDNIKPPEVLLWLLFLRPLFRRPYSAEQ